MRSRSHLLLAVAVVLSGCYHATIETGAKPSNVTIQNQWASGWLYGLVPPKTVETAAQCPTGVSRVETQHSFLNELVGFLTLGIYTPMDIRVACAEGAVGATSLLVPDSASVATWRAAIAAAVTKAEAEGHPVYVQVVR